MQSLYLADETATLALGARLAQTLSAGHVVALNGDLGAGKTTLARGVIKTLCDVDEIPSPTYTLVQIYDGPDAELWHCDMYRLERPEDAFELGLIEAFDEAICLIEWPDKLGDVLPVEAFRVNIAFEGKGRRADLTGWEDGAFDT